MTTATAVKEERLNVEQVHPVFSSTYQIQIAETELRKLGAQEAARAEERMAIIKGETGAQGNKTRLEDLEREINRLQVRQSREGDKIAALTNELPELRVEAEAQRDKLIALEERLPKASLEIESINAQLASLLNVDLVEQLTGLMEKRNTLVKEYRGIPFLIQNLKGYFHLQPGVREVEVPKLPEHISELIGALSK